jgi:hypothetical protein
MFLKAAIPISERTGTCSNLVIRTDSLGMPNLIDSGARTQVRDPESQKSNMLLLGFWVSKGP